MFAFPREPAENCPMTQDIRLPPGTRVRYDGREGDPEFGIVVHSWFSAEIGGYDCYVAFFGSAPPSGAPERVPYVLRYASSSLAMAE
jgi:hypothetical protein